MKKIYIGLLTLVFVFTGCGTKRQYFEPEKISADVVYTGSLPSPMVELSRYGATLSNGQFISKEGLQGIKLEDGFNYFGEFDDRYIALDNQGGLKVLDKSGQVQYEKKFPKSIVSASVNGDVLAGIDSSNSLFIMDMKSGNFYFVNRQDLAYAVDARVAAPYFLNSLVIFPTLDGKLVIVDWKNGKMIRDIVISSNPFFNNVIYLDVFNNQLVAATARRVISIAPSDTYFFDEKIKDLLVFDDSLLVLAQDGRVMILDKNLKIKKEHKFPFAILLSAMEEDGLYFMEKKGHLIESDKDLENIKVYELPDEVEKPIFMSNDTIFYDDNVIKLHSK
ncbi:MAG: hypothetical protein CR967_04005 [Proteobacteria bacterium]|nr:MAG: hypothetical protein CR967_04005 [Pseudomonadota bacterium]